MRCGAKCFLVEFEKDGVKQVMPVNARTAAGARKIIREEFGANLAISKVYEEKRKS
ncbi:hypothetical protein QR721_13160 [Aciduricibacillus chroicocephali]|uniref:Uncharacterized protein n=1 Tax=Aciduricibacillus chroicocephali TaxID=3054939 RepID=A0ABY9KY90_9BACI|nr:hypothetical protein QR721_13160 [Bacillaceae bacterium 44XB]